jgi:hypothetical protein
MVRAMVRVRVMVMVRVGLRLGLGFGVRVKLNPKLDVNVNKSRRMCVLNKRKRDNLHAVKGQKAPTSYGRLIRKKYLACKVELAELKGVDYEKNSEGVYD